MSSSGLTTEITVHGIVESAKCQPVLVSSTPHAVELAGKVVLQKVPGSGGKPVVASA